MKHSFIISILLLILICELYKSTNSYNCYSYMSSANSVLNNNNDARTVRIDEEVKVVTQNNNTRTILYEYINTEQGSVHVEVYAKQLENGVENVLPIPYIYNLTGKTRISDIITNNNLVYSGNNITYYIRFLSRNMYDRQQNYINQLRQHTINFNKCIDTQKQLGKNPSQISIICNRT